MKFVQINSFSLLKNFVLPISNLLMQHMEEGTNLSICAYLAKFDTIKITGKLKEIDIYLIIDIRKGEYKAHTFDQI
jgi:hypothetical protein